MKMADMRRQPGLLYAVAGLLWFAVSVVPVQAASSRTQAQPGPLQQCAIKMAHVARALGLSRTYANVKSITASCERAGNSHMTASRNFLASVVRADGTERRPRAAPAVSKRCVAQVGRVVAVLGVTGKEAEAKMFHDVCARGNGRALLASRDLLITHIRRTGGS